MRVRTEYVCEGEEPRWKSEATGSRDEKAEMGGEMFPAFRKVSA